jgi:hypothetical protein
VGIRDFIQHLREHQERLRRGSGLSTSEREETLREAETMVGMADAAIKELESVLDNRRINLPEEHRHDEEKDKHALRDPTPRNHAGA